MSVTFDPATAVAAGQRIAVCADAARRGPVQRVEVTGFGEAWLVTGWAEVRQALADPRLHKAPAAAGRLARELRPDLAPAVFRHMLSMDGEPHTRLRGLVATAFTRQRVQDLQPRISALTDALLDALAALGPDVTVDLMESFAYPLPLSVIFEMLGVPADWREDIHRCFTDVFAASFIPAERFIAALAELADLTRGLVALRRAEPGPDLLSALISVRESGDQLSEDELTSMMVLLLAAGHETTANLIGNGVRSLLAHPDQVATLRAGSTAAIVAVEELLRFDPPVHMGFPLRAIDDLAIGTARIARHDLVFVSLLAANRDDAHVTHADRLDLARTPNQHLTFGHGVHHCLGATLARLEGQIALVRLFGRFPHLHPTVPLDALVLNPNLLFNGLTALPVRLGAQAQS
jgi:cytochrome P450